MEPEARPDSPLVARLHPSPNHGERNGVMRPDSIILHYTGMRDAASALLWLCNPLAQVSSHYFVFEDGRIFQLVPENRRAWHAGKSSWLGETDLNSASIGIEIAHPGHDFGAFDADGKPVAIPSTPYPPPGPPFAEAQIEAVIRLVADIKTRWSIADRRILAHSDIAPGRKIDPGERFPWVRLAEAGLGLWAKPQPPFSAITYRSGDEGMPIRAVQAMFLRFGYALDMTGVYDAQTEAVVAAFQRHWRQGQVDGIADGETLAILRALMSIATA